MKKRIAINGFGRIGRLFYRALLEKDMLNDAVDVVVANDIVTADNLAYLLKYDSAQGSLPFKVELKDSDTIKITNTSTNKEYELKCIVSKTAPVELPWKDYNIDVVVEATGLFTKTADASGHIKAGAKKVIITAPSDEDVKNFLVGVNAEKYNGEDMISNASCTTNCLAPLVFALIKGGIGLKEGLMNTSHAYTADQGIQDSPKLKDFRRGRAAGINLVPTSSGAAKAIGQVIPEMKGKLTGIAIRTPNIVGSLLDLTFKPERPTSIEEINSVMKIASETYLKGILQYTDELIVSCDVIHNPNSCIYDSAASLELNPEFFKLIAWYDNEWGYSNRLADLLDTVIKHV